MYLFNYFTAVGLPNSVSGIEPSNICFLKSLTLLSMSVCLAPFKTSTNVLWKNLKSIANQWKIK